MTQPTLDWESYLSVAQPDEMAAQCRRACAPVFKNQRDNLGRLHGVIGPKRVACLGAGCLNDIPVDEFLRRGSEVYLADWIPRISECGFQGDLIRREGETHTCFVCDVPCSPERFCAGFYKAEPQPGGVCDNFRLIEEGLRLGCASYRPGVQPHFLTADITLGRASGFAKRVTRLVASCHSPEKCFRRAIEVCRQCATLNEELLIPSDSIDMVTSSMVLSQFDHEPYGYFSKLLAQQFGARLLREERKLTPWMERLRTELFRIQAEGHVKEMYRLVNKKHGKVYFSVELFHATPDSEEFFLVREIPEAMTILQKYFAFDFKTLPYEQTLQKIVMPSGSSIIQSYVLTPLQDPT